MQTAYDRFKKAVIVHSGSIEDWLYENRLPWPDAPLSDWPFLRADMPSVLYRITPNDFPCDRPADVSHLLLQSHVPILDRSLATDEAEWADVVERGVLFLTGMPEHVDCGIGLGVASELRKLVITLWPEDRFETIIWVRTALIRPL